MTSQLPVGKITLQLNVEGSWIPVFRVMLTIPVGDSWGRCYDRSLRHELFLAPALEACMVQVSYYLRGSSI